MNWKKVLDFALPFAEWWRRNSIGKRLTHRLFPKIMARIDERRAVRRARRAARKAKRPRQFDEAAGEFFSNDEVTGMSIPKHWLSGGGIIAVLIGLVLTLFGVGECSPQEIADGVQSCLAPGTVDRIVGAVNELLIGGGAVIALAGKKRAMKREAELEAAAEAKK